MHAPPFVPRESAVGPSCSTAAVNVGQDERLVSLGVGSALLLNSLIGPRRSRPLSLLVAAGLLYRGMTGHCHGYELLGIDSSQKDRRPDIEHSDFQPD
jgi:hypothetical protein